MFTSPGDRAGRKSNRYRGALVKKSVDQTAANYTSSTAVTWDVNVEDTDSFHSTATNTSRFTIPNGVRHINLNGAVAISSITANVFVDIWFTKNGAIIPGTNECGTSVNSTNRQVSTTSLGLQVAPGDYVEMVMNIQTDNSVTVVASQSNFAIQVVD